MPYEQHPEYEKLPECFKLILTPEQHAWMSEQAKANLEEEFCYPDDEGEA